MEQLTSEEFEQSVEQTRISDNIKHAARLVLVEGVRCTNAAVKVGETRQAVHAAVKTILRKYKSIEIPKGCRMVKVCLPHAQADKLERRCRLKKANRAKESK